MLTQSMSHTDTSKGGHPPAPWPPPLDGACVVPPLDGTCVVPPAEEATNLIIPIIAVLVGK